MRKRREQAGPDRQPHQDPLVEARLQQILSVQRTAARKEDQIAVNSREIGKRLRRSRGQTFGSADTTMKEAAALAEENRLTEQEVAAARAEAVRLMNELDATDLAYL